MKNDVADDSIATKTDDKQESKLMDSLFSVGAHLGYSKSRRHPSTKSFVFGSKNRIDIINLESTTDSLNKALDFVASLAKEGKQILFVGNKYEARKVLSDAAEKLSMPYSASRWIGGTLTNFQEMRKRVARLEDLLQKKDKGELDIFTKKERVVIDREIEDLNKHFGGVVSMRKLPSALFVIDAKEEETAVNEAIRLAIPVVALCATDCDLQKISYPIVANDSSIDSIRFFIDKVAEVYQKSFKPKVNLPEKPEVSNQTV